MGTAHKHGYLYGLSTAYHLTEEKKVEEKKAQELATKEGRVFDAEAFDRDFWKKNEAKAYGRAD